MKAENTEEECEAEPRIRILARGNWGCIDSQSNNVHGDRRGPPGLVFPVLDDGREGILLVSRQSSELPMQRSIHLL